MPRPGDILTHEQMSAAEGRYMQKGMNFRPRGVSVFLMSRRANAPYPDRIEDDGTTLIYEGHDISGVAGGADTKTVDQPLVKPDGKPSDNAKFVAAAQSAKSGGPPAMVRVYEKLKPNIWAFTGTFHLVDSWQESDSGRRVFKFKLRLTWDGGDHGSGGRSLKHTRIIPPSVKVEVWKRDQGKCRTCGLTDNLHFDHILPFSKGGTSIVADNVQILCARHNLAKGANIE